MKITLNESEVREAVAAYIKANYGVTVDPKQLQPNMVTHGQYDDAETIMEGYSVEIGKGVKLELKAPPSGTTKPTPPPAKPTQTRRKK